MWPFKKKTNSNLHPLLQQFKEIMQNPRCIEWFEKVANGLTHSLPLDVASSVQEAIKSVEFDYGHGGDPLHDAGPSSQE